jgi:hypothetical protein
VRRDPPEVRCAASTRSPSKPHLNSPHLCLRLCRSFHCARTEPPVTYPSPRFDHSQSVYGVVFTADLRRAARHRLGPLLLRNRTISRHFLCKPRQVRLSSCSAIQLCCRRGLPTCSRAVHNRAYCCVRHCPDRPSEPHWEERPASFRGRMA